MSTDGLSSAINIVEFAYGDEDLSLDLTDSDGNSYIEAIVDLSSTFIHLPSS